ncbi:MAG: hypothetical protein AB7O48_03960 [Cyclobacteriaceae bacterium]
MRPTTSIATRIVLISVLCSTYQFSTAQPSNQSKDAWQAADQLLESLGGREIWASTKILYVKEKAFPESLFHPVTAEFWHNLEKPAYHSIIVGHDFRQETVWDENSGWINRNGMKKEISNDDITQEIGDWSQQPYVVYHKLAIRDPLIHLVLKDGDLQIYEGDGGRLLCWFRMDAHGRLLMWGNYYKGEIIEHVYGPTKPIGEYVMPAWGTATKGSWRFEYLELKSVDNMGTETGH